ncbi:MAG: thymidine phosphorylase [Endomicrobiaceae bacterium]|nr:thymidine phosphorylase [Endomicrobiaceae bacterium]MDD3729571.1 thymidine phosphorylase [Endomicrobiaceae bacterium]MDD4165637.1 thymidine phosphorylase [Endomicrobiaceae bacterium]
MRAYDIIFKKRNNKKLTQKEILFLINGYANNEIADYQMSAFLMAVYFSGLDDDELFYLTEAMAKSGKILNLNSLKTTADKHSTGGVGDGTSLVVAPITASCGIYVPMMSGRALGHTGGTLDKLESIPGFNVNLDINSFIDLLKKNKAALIGQTKEIAPVDKKMYALRDVTATVESIPLICASIMSKKIAEGAKHIILDVKFGNGAFIENYDDAKKLAEKMVNIGKMFKRKMTAILSDMNTPLGNAIGNSLEVIQAVEVLKGNIKNDFYQLCIELSSLMIYSSGAAKDKETAKKLAEKQIVSGKALKKFRQIIESQNGNSKVIDDYSLFGQSKNILAVKSEKSGFVNSMNARNFGIASCMLGAGRLKKEDAVDHAAGITLNKKTGDFVKSGETLAKIHFTNCENPDNIKKMIKLSYNISDVKPDKVNLFKDIIT